MTLATIGLSIWLAAQPLPAALAVGPDGQPLSASDWEELRGGKVLVHVEKVEGSKIDRAVGVAQFESAGEAVFDVLRDYERHPEYMPYVRKVTLRERAGERSTVDFDLDLPWPAGNRHYSLELTDRSERVDGVEVWVSRWRYVPGSGNIADTYGGWQIIPLGPERSLVRYTVYTDPGGALPVFLRNMATKVGVPRVLRQLRERVKKLSRPRRLEITKP